MRALLLLLFGWLALGLVPAQAQVAPSNVSKADSLNRAAIEQARRDREQQRRYLDSVLGRTATQPVPKRQRARRTQTAPTPLPGILTPSSASAPKPTAPAIDTTAPRWIQRRQARRLGLPEPTTPAPKRKPAPLMPVPAPPDPPTEPVPAPVPTATEVPPAAPDEPAFWVGGVLQSWLYQGDLGGTSNFYPGGGFRVLTGSGRRVQGLVQVSYGQFAASDPTLDPDALGLPNRYAQTALWAIDVQARVRFLRRHALQPFVAPGFSYLLFTPKDSRGANLRDQAGTRNVGETYPAGALALPLTTGFTWRLNRHLALTLDYSYLLSSTDYLDNIGELGPQSGNDRLHRISAGVHVGIN